MKRSSAIASVYLLGLSWLAFSPPAVASKNFPEALRSRLGLAELPYPPQGCQLCHQNDEGGPRTATKPFGRTLLKNGTAGGSVPSLYAALKSVEADGSDSDGDGVSDIAELRADTDPNVALSSSGEPLPMDEIPLPQTGCQLAAPRGSSVGALPLLLGAVCSLALRRRRSR